MNMLLLIGFPKEEIELLQNNLKEDIYPVSEELSDWILEDIIREKRDVGYHRFGHQRIVIMHEIPKETLGEIIKNIRAIIKEHTIFATSTPTSLKWPLFKLVEELIEEDEYFRTK